MRIKIKGDNECAKALRGLLRQADFAVTEFLPDEAVRAGYTVSIEETPGPLIHFDSIDCPLEAAILRQVTSSFLPGCHTCSRHESQEMAWLS